MEKHPLWDFENWEKAKSDFEINQKKWNEKWKNIKESLKDVNHYYKVTDKNYESLVRWIDNYFYGSYGMSDKPCSLFGKSIDYTINNALIDEAAGKLDIKKYSSFFDECLKKDKGNVDEIGRAHV